jgi:hypothetical protein
MKRLTIRTFLVLSAVLGVVSLTACATVTPASAGTSEGDNTTSAAKTTDVEDDAPAPAPSFSEDAGPVELMRNLTPRNGSAVFLGVAARLQDREEERDAAILHIAEQASRYVWIRASYRFISERNTSSIGYLDDIDAAWDTEYADSLVDSVEVVFETQDHAGTYVLGTVPDLPTPPQSAQIAVPPEGEPAWINDPPAIPGFLTAVGVVTPSRRFRDSVDRADQEALKGLLQQTGTTVRMIEDRRDEERSGTQMRVTTAQEAEATLRSFYVLSRYATPDQRYYYSLAIAEEE